MLSGAGVEEGKNLPLVGATLGEPRKQRLAEIHGLQVLALIRKSILNKDTEWGKEFIVLNRMALKEGESGNTPVFPICKWKEF